MPISTAPVAAHGFVMWIVAMAARHSVPDATSTQAFVDNNLKAAAATITAEVEAFNACVDSCQDVTCTKYNPNSGICIKRSVPQGCESHYHDIIQERCVANNYNAHMRVNGISCRDIPEKKVDFVNSYMTFYKEHYSGNCYTEDRNALMSNTGANPVQPHGFFKCAPTKCLSKLGTYTFDVARSFIRKPLICEKCNGQPLQDDSVGNHVIANVTTATYFNGTRLAFNRASLLAHWLTSQAAANIASACTTFKTYNNVSEVIHSLGFLPSESGLILPSLVNLRYPKAAVVLKTAAALANTENLCQVF